MFCVAKVVLISVSFLVCLGQAVHQVVGGLIGDVGQKPVHQRPVPLQLKLDSLPEKRRVDCGTSTAMLFC